MNLFGNSPQKDKRRKRQKNPRIRKLEKIIIKKNSKKLFDYHKDQNNNSNSSLPDYSKVNYIQRSMKELNFYKKSKKEQLSDSIILELQKEKNKEKLLSKNNNSENKLKKMLKKSDFIILPHETPSSNRLSPEKIKSQKTWTRPSSPNKKTLNFLQTYNKSAKTKLINNLKKNFIPYKDMFLIDQSSKNPKKKLNFKIFTSNNNIFGSESVTQKSKNRKMLNM